MKPIVFLSLLTMLFTTVTVHAAAPGVDVHKDMVFDACYAGNGAFDAAGVGGFLFHGSVNHFVAQGYFGATGGGNPSTSYLAFTVGYEYKLPLGPGVNLGADANVGVANIEQKWIFPWVTKNTLEPMVACSVFSEFKVPIGKGGGFFSRASVGYSHVLDVERLQDLQITLGAGAYFE